MLVMKLERLEKENEEQQQKLKELDSRNLGLEEQRIQLESKNEEL